jgi:hypothetical protein
MNPSANGRPRERGAVLVVSLIMLAVMTLLVVSMLKTAVIELKIGGVSQIAALNLANAEIAINNFIAANNGRFAPNFLTLAPGSGGPINTPPVVNGGTVAVAATQLACGPWATFNTQMGGTSLQAVQFDIRATATGTLGGTTVLHQGVQSLAPPGSC